jgi:hypothetical protein
VKLEIEIDDQRIFELLDSARVDYWGTLHMHTSIGNAPLIERTFFVTVHEEGKAKDEPDMCKLNFVRGIQLAITKHPRILDPNQLDAETGDMFVQLCAFGELRYG